jgi:hypothetical protein
MGKHILPEGASSCTISLSLDFTNYIVDKSLFDMIIFVSERKF